MIVVFDGETFNFDGPVHKVSMDNGELVVNGKLISTTTNPKD